MQQGNAKQGDQVGKGNVRPLRVDQGKVPDPEVTDRPAVRRFTAEYKVRILQEADQLSQAELGALLRREGLYRKQMNEWRKQRDHAMQKWMEPQKPGPKPESPNPLADELAQLKRENAALQRRLKQAEAIIEVQKNLRDPFDSSESARERQERLISAVPALGAEVGVVDTCRALGVPRATFYRHRNHTDGPKAPRPKPARALSEVEQQKVLDVFHEERFMDKAPAEVYARLLDEAKYLCSIRTMYRILHAANEVKERRNRVRHPVYTKPELLATGPNQVWSWDITKLKGPAKWQHYCLYVIMDIFSRCVVGWMIAERESETLAQRLIADTLRKHDNPYSEAQFKTLKYRPDFPERFGSLEDARSFCRSFFRWYNQEHYHSGIALLTPATVHLGQADEVIQRRSAVLEAAYEAHPERFVRTKPSHVPLPAAAWINPPTVDSSAADSSS